MAGTRCFAGRCGIICPTLGLILISNRDCLKPLCTRFSISSQIVIIRMFLLYMHVCMYVCNQSLFESCYILGLNNNLGHPFLQSSYALLEKNTSFISSEFATFKNHQMSPQSYVLKPENRSSKFTFPRPLFHRLILLFIFLQR